ncbi:hypothetical protein RHGRI_038169 [Rhododendron griersonianum]|uniref:CCHC-type domain-containing protein n=1 Tax=Rhododendron griersonianum TaxID=479676 RepID=A0AAV6HV82_9ERIC|nr:hypothetical protein RHGRI_038169 [Rhododendron griersonianum]
MDPKKSSAKVLMLPWLAHGHITPFLELAKTLSTKNFEIYLCSTPINLSSIQNRITKTQYSLPIKLTPLHLPPSPELPPHHHTTNGLPPRLIPALINAFEMASPSFSHVLQTLSPDLVIYDSMLPWAPIITSENKIPAVEFITTGAAVNARSLAAQPPEEASGFSTEEEDLLERNQCKLGLPLAQVSVPISNPPLTISNPPSSSLSPDPPPSNLAPPPINPVPNPNHLLTKPFSIVPNSGSLSFKDTLNGVGPSELALLSETDCFSDDDEEEDPSCPSIKLTKEDKIRTRQPWKLSLIIKVVGKSFALSFLMAKLRSLWKMVDTFSGFDLGLGFILVKFKSELDLHRALHGGPWFIGPHFISVRKWEAGFQPSRATISTSAIWVQLPELPLEMYDKAILQKIGAKIGVLLKIDVQTESGTKLRFARLCVQVDLNAPLISWVKVGKHRQRVAYEGISSICFHCGVVGHKLLDCPQKNPTPVTNSAEEQYGKWMLAGRKTFPSQKQKPVPNFPYMDSGKARVAQSLGKGNKLSQPKLTPLVVDPSASSSVPITPNPFQVLSSPLLVPAIPDKPNKKAISDNSSSVIPRTSLGVIPINRSVPSANPLNALSSPPKPNKPILAKELVTPTLFSKASPKNKNGSAPPIPSIQQAPHTNLTNSTKPTPPETSDSLLPDVLPVPNLGSGTLTVCLPSGVQPSGCRDHSSEPPNSARLLSLRKTARRGGVSAPSEPKCGTKNNGKNNGTPGTRGGMDILGGGGTTNP